MEQPAVVLVVVLAVAAANQTVISLNGDNWILSDSFGRVKAVNLRGFFSNEMTQNFQQR